MAFSLDNNESGFGGGKTSMLVDINVTPLVDVMLVLIIILMVAAPFAVSGVNVNLPASKAKPLALRGDPVILSVTQSGQFFLGKSRIIGKDLSEKLKAVKGSDKDLLLYIRADKGVPYGKVMEAMAAAQRVGIYKIAMLGESLHSRK